jgi:hypothetical protein
MRESETETAPRAGMSTWRGVRPPEPHVEAVLVGLVVVVVHLLASFASALLVGAINDDGVYLVLGRALAEGHGYHSAHLVGSPVQVKYPPGFPLVLAFLWQLGGSVEAVQRIVGVLHPVLLGLAAGLLWWVGRDRIKAPRSLLLLLVLLPFLLEASIQYSSIILSEPWLILGWAGVVALWTVSSSAMPGRRRLVLLAATGLLLAATTLVRTQGGVLLPAIAFALFARRFSALERVVALTTGIVPLGIWQLYHSALVARGPVSSLPDEGPYLRWMQAGGTEQLSALVGEVRVNLGSYLSQFGAYFSSVGPLGWGLAVLILGGTVVGAVFAIRREPLLALSALGGTALVVLWPFAQDRLLLPVLPFLGLAAAAALTPRLLRWPAPVGRGLGYVCALIAATILLRQPDVRHEAVNAFVEGRPPTFFTPGYVLLLNSRYIAHASRWVRDNTRPTDRLMIDNHPGIYLYSGRSTLPANPSESRLQVSVFAVPGQYLATHILRDSINYVIVGLRRPGIMRDLETVTARCPGVLSWGGTGPNDSKYIYRVRRDEACLGSLARTTQ